MLTQTTDNKTVGTPLTPLAAFLYSLANFGFGSFYAFNNYVLTQWITGYTQNASIIGLVGGTHSFEGAVIQPIIGAWSDKLHSRFGRRRPFILVFIPISALFMLLTPAAAHLPGSLRLAAILVCIFVFTLTFNIAVDPYHALLADITLPAQRGRTIGFWYFIGAAGQVAILFTPASLELKFSIVGIAMLMTTIVTCFATKEATHAGSSPTADPTDLKRHFRGLWVAFKSLRTLAQARCYLAMYFLYGAGVGAVVPYLTLFIEKITKCSDQSAQHIVIALLAATALGSPPLGWVADKIGSYWLLVIGISLIAFAALNGLWVTTPPEVVGVLILAGLGTAAQNASAYPLLIRLVPSGEIGLYTGLQSTALSISAPLAALVTGVIINHSGYRAIFVVCFVCAGLAIGILRQLRPLAAPMEIAALEQMGIL
jgi:maltose/moltooligosaccharide transporter